MTRLRHHSPPLRVVRAEDEQLPAAQLSATGASSGAVLLIFASLFAWGWQPALTFQPTIVGILWAGMFLAGYMVGGVGRGRLTTLLLVAPLTYLSWQAFVSLTDLGAADSLLLVAILLVGGWGATQCQRFYSSVHVIEEPSQLKVGRCSIWDIGFVTTIAACVVHALPRLETPPMLSFAVATSLFAGLLCSWIACTWAWKDDWNWWSILALMATLAVGATSLWLSAPPGLSLGHAVQWGLIGPVNVIAAQGTVVLAILTSWRWEHDRLGRPNVARPSVSGSNVARLSES